MQDDDYIERRKALGAMCDAEFARRRLALQYPSQEELEDLMHEVAADLVDPDEWTYRVLPVIGGVLISLRRRVED